MTDPDYVHAALLIDRSGSMSSIREDAQGGINSFIEEQKQVPGKMTLSVYQFDTEYEKVYGPVLIADAAGYALYPRGMTALNDALGRSITETGEWLASLPEDQRPGKVIFTIVTDGQENASREWTLAKCKELITQQQDDYGWEFVYVGANVDAFATGASYGMAGSTQYQATAASTQQVYTRMSKSMSGLRTNNLGGASYSSVMSGNVDTDMTFVVPSTQSPEKEDSAKAQQEDKDES